MGFGPQGQQAYLEPVNFSLWLPVPGGGGAAGETKAPLLPLDLLCTGPCGWGQRL